MVVNFLLQSKQLEDDSEYLSYGVSEEESFLTLKTDGNLIYSSWNEFPSAENPYSDYKFASFAVMRESDVEVISRQGYSVLDWLGDWGGLMDALIMIADILMIPLRRLAFASTLASIFVKVRPQTNKMENAEERIIAF
mmetsp:Transcript_2845/g.3878  ORF Transcript_2845/g.3878 Transcript_2845/m.3878 type:complete len:138 (+) Transcript_2845:506-919(+)